VGPKISTDGGTHHMIEGIIPGIYIYYTQIVLFLRSHHFGKCSYLTFLYIIGYNNISKRPHDPPIPKSGGRDPPGLTPM